MTDVSTDEMVERLRQSLNTLLRWAELYQPRTVLEREQYDIDLDEAEDLLEAVEAWVAHNGERRVRTVPKKGP